MPSVPYDVLLVHAPRAVEPARRFADRLRHIGISPWLALEQVDPALHPLEAARQGVDAAGHIALWLEPELVLAPWFPDAMRLFGQAQARGQRVFAWGSVPWDARRLGPPPEGLDAIPEHLDDDARLWLAACTLGGEHPGPAGDWSAHGHELVVRPLWDKDEQAQQLVESGDLHGAADLYSDILDADPEQFSAYVSRGRVYLDLGDYSRAMSDFMRAQEIAEHPDADVAMGDLFFARKEYARAIGHYDAALDQLPDHAMALARRGMALHYRKRHREALADLERAEALDPDIPNLGTYVAMVRRKAR